MISFMLTVYITMFCNRFQNKIDQVLYELSLRQGGSIYRSGAENWGISTRFRRRRRREKFLSTFFEIFGKVVNKNAIKSDF